MLGKLFGNVKNTAIKKLVKSQLKNVPTEQREMIEQMVEKNPELFAKIAQEAQELVKGGMDQMTAMMQVSQKYKGDLQKLMK